MGKTKYQIQFQKGLGLPEFLEQFGSEEQCERQLASLKWPYGFICTHCKGKDVSIFSRNNPPYFQCSCCRHQSTLTSNTFHSFECSKYSLGYLGTIMYRFNHPYELDKIFAELLEDAMASPPADIHVIKL